MPTRPFMHRETSSDGAVTAAEERLSTALYTQRTPARDGLTRRRFHPDAGSMRKSCQPANVRPAG